MSDIRIGLIGGSGLGAVLAEQTSGILNVIDTPFGPPSAPIVETEWNGVPVFYLSRHGPGHTLNPSGVPYRANIFALKKLGVTHVIASGAVGSLREEYRPRDLAIVDQIIDKTRRPATFYDAAAVHVEFAEPFCPVLRNVLLEAGAFVALAGEGSGLDAGDASAAPADAASSAKPAFHVHDGGCYVAMEGPAFSTRAESLMHRLWGGDVIGMTAMPEAKLAKEAEIGYALIALVTDYDCWKMPAPPKLGEPAPAKPDPFALLSEIIGHLSAATQNAIAVMRKAVELIAADPALVADYPAREALKLAIWSNKSQIPTSEVQRLAPLWVKYLRS